MFVSVEDKTPLASILRFVPTFIPPNTVVEAVGKVYATISEVNANVPVALGSV